MKFRLVEGWGGRIGGVAATLPSWIETPGELQRLEELLIAVAQATLGAPTTPTGTTTAPPHVAKGHHHLGVRLQQALLQRGRKGEPAKISSSSSLPDVLRQIGAWARERHVPTSKEELPSAFAAEISSSVVELVLFLMKRNLVLDCVEKKEATISDSSSGRSATTSAPSIGRSRGVFAFFSRSDHSSITPFFVLVTRMPEAQQAEEQGKVEETARAAALPRLLGDLGVKPSRGLLRGGSLESKNWTTLCANQVLHLVGARHLDKQLLLPTVKEEGSGTPLAVPSFERLQRGGGGGGTNDIQSGVDDFGIEQRALDFGASTMAG